MKKILGIFCLSVALLSGCGDPEEPQQNQSTNQNENNNSSNGESNTDTALNQNNCPTGFTGQNCDQCSVGFAGEKCDSCAGGYFGNNCKPCEACGIHGRCNDGKDGDGVCECSVGYNGLTF